MKALILAAIFMVAHGASATEIKCASKAKRMIRAILSIQENARVRVKILSSKHEDDGVQIYETFDVQGWTVDASGKEVAVRVPSRIVLMPESDTCAMVTYSLPGAG